MLTVTVDDRPLPVAPVVEHGRVLLPLRATFSALGASISYDAQGRVVVARTAQRWLRLPMSDLRVIANRTYVRLRFVAESLGAIVGYDANAQLVTIAIPHTRTANAASTAIAVMQQPQPGTRIGNAFPMISASVGTNTAAPGTIKLTVDGVDVTRLATFDGSTITYLPRTGLPPGPHTVTFSGTTASNGPFNSSWTFDTTASAPPNDPAPPFTPFDYKFYSNGNTFYGGEWMHFTLIAPPGGTAELQVCNLGIRYPMFNGGQGEAYEADVPAPLGYWIPMCDVTAVYTSWNGSRTYVPIPIGISIYTRAEHPHSRPTPAPTPKPRPTQTPVPTPRPEPRKIAPAPRRAEPTPHPKPTPR